MMAGWAEEPSPLVSVIVPVFNAGDFLERTVASIQEQTHTALEIILIDDGSTDGSGAICDRIAAGDPRVQVVHQPNRGIAAAQNAGLDRARGRYLTFCDNDDLMAPGLVARLVEALVDADADMSCCRWWNVGASVAEATMREHAADPAGRTIIVDRPAEAYQRVFSLAHRTLGRRELHYFSEANWGKLYRADLWRGVRFPDGRFAQDVAVSVDLYLRMRRVASCSDVLYYWIQRPQSVSHKTKKTVYYHDIVQAHARAFDLSLRAGITPARAFGGLMTLDAERASVTTAEERELYAADAREVRGLIRRLTPGQRWLCRGMFWIRRVETWVYRMTVHRRR